MLSIFLKDTVDLFLEYLKNIKRKLVLGEITKKKRLNKFKPINKYRDKSPYHRSQINRSRENNHKRTPEKYRNKITIVILIDDSIIEKISVQEHQRDIKITIEIPMDDSIIEKTASKEHQKDIEIIITIGILTDDCISGEIIMKEHQRSIEIILKTAKHPNFKEIVIKKKQKELCVIDAMKKNTILIMVYIVKKTSRI